MKSPLKLHPALETGNIQISREGDGKAAVSSEEVKLEMSKNLEE